MSKMKIRNKVPKAIAEVTGDHLDLLKDCREMLRESKPGQVISNDDIMKMVIELAHLALVTSRKIAAQNAAAALLEEDSLLAALDKEIGGGE